MELKEEDVRLLLSFCPTDLPEEVPEGLDPTFYYTGSYEGDLKIAERLKRINDIRAGIST